MGVKKFAMAFGLGLLLATRALSIAVAQGVLILTVTPLVNAFATSELHYQYLLDSAHGGTQHTYESVPKWEGQWSPGGNSMFSLFLVDGTMAPAMAPVDALVKEGVLTPAYEEAYRAPRRDGGIRRTAP